MNKNSRNGIGSLYRIEQVRYSREKSGLNTLIPYRRIMERVFTKQRPEENGALVESLRILFDFLTGIENSNMNGSNHDLYIGARIDMGKAGELPLLTEASAELTNKTYAVLYRIRLKTEEVLFRSMELCEKISLSHTPHFYRNLITDQKAFVNHLKFLFDTSFPKVIPKLPDLVHCRSSLLTLENDIEKLRDTPPEKQDEYLYENIFRALLQLRRTDTELIDFILEIQ